MSLKSKITDKLKQQFSKKIDQVDAKVTDAENQIVMDPDQAQYTALPAGTDLEAIREKCQDMVKKRALAAAAVSAVPVPLVSLTVDAALLTELLPEISARFGLTPPPQPIYNRETGEWNWPEIRDYGVDFVALLAKRGIVRKSVDGLGANFLVRFLSRYIPVVGTVSSASINYFVFKRIAGDYINKCYDNAKRLEREGKNSTNNPKPVIAQALLEKVNEIAGKDKKSK